MQGTPGDKIMKKNTNYSYKTLETIQQESLKSIKPQGKTCYNKEELQTKCN